MIVNLKNAMYNILSHNKLNVQNIRSQGFDGASNVQDEFHGL